MSEPALLLKDGEVLQSFDIEPGIYTDMPNDVYHGHHGSYSKTSLVDCSEYPLKVPFNRSNNTRKKTFDIGTASHAAILEPETIDNVIAIVPDECLKSNGAINSKPYKEWEKTIPVSKAILKQHERDTVLRVRDSVHENPDHSEAHEYLSGGIPEVSFFWHEQFRGEFIDPETAYRYMRIDNYSDPGIDDAPENYHRIMMKCRPDYIPHDDIWSDLKTTAQTIVKDKWQKHSENLHYHWSAALSRRGLRRSLNKNLREYIFVVVEIEPPFEVAVYRTTQDQFALGTIEIASTMQVLAWCDKHNKWPGIPNKVQNLGLTGWSYNKLVNYKGDIL